MLEHRSDFDRLRRANLNLLPLCYAFLQHKSISRTAQDLGITAAAVSASVSELRDLFQDPLVTDLGVAPILTPRAIRLLEDLRPIMTDLAALLTPAEAFDPSRNTLHMRIGALDTWVALLAPALARYLEQHAPNITFEFCRPYIGDRFDLDKVDVLIIPAGMIEKFPKKYDSLHLADDAPGFLVRQGDVIGDNATAAEIRSRPQVAIDQSSILSKSLHFQSWQNCGFDHKNAVVFPSVIAALGMVEDMGYLCPATRWDFMLARNRYAVEFRRLDALRTTWDLHAIWSETASVRKGHAWFVRALRDVARQIFITVT